MSVKAISTAHASTVLITANPDLHTLNIGIRPAVDGGVRPFKSRTFDSATFDFDTAGLLRNIELQIATQTTTRAAITMPDPVPGYFVITVASDEWPQWDEHLFYDADKRIACFAFSGELLPARLYRISDQLGVGVTDLGGLCSVWLFGETLAAFL